jgi:hypothetical protein
MTLAITPGQLIDVGLEAGCFVGGFFFLEVGCFVGGFFFLEVGCFVGGFFLVRGTLQSIPFILLQDFIFIFIGGRGGACCADTTVGGTKARRTGRRAVATTIFILPFCWLVLGAAAAKEGHFRVRGGERGFIQ